MLFYNFPAIKNIDMNGFANFMFFLMMEELIGAPFFAMLSNYYKTETIQSTCIQF